MEDVGRDITRKTFELPNDLLFAIEREVGQPYPLNMTSCVKLLLTEALEARRGREVT